MRNIALAALLTLCACGTVCDGVAHSEQAANAKGSNCGSGQITVHDANKCNNGLQKCNSDDLQELKNYAACLDQLPTCTAENKTSFEFSRAGCVLQPFGRITFTCSSAIF